MASGFDPSEYAHILGNNGPTAAPAAAETAPDADDEGMTLGPTGPMPPANGPGIVRYGAGAAGLAVAGIGGLALTHTPLLTQILLDATGAAALGAHVADRYGYLAGASNRFMRNLGPITKTAFGGAVGLLASDIWSGGFHLPPHPVIFPAIGAGLTAAYQFVEPVRNVMNAAFRTAGRALLGVGALAAGSIASAIRNPNAHKFIIGAAAVGVGGAAALWAFDNPNHVLNAFRGTLDAPVGQLRPTVVHNWKALGAGIVGLTSATLTSVGMESGFQVFAARNSFKRILFASVAVVSAYTGVFFHDHLKSGRPFVNNAIGTEQIMEAPKKPAQSLKIITGKQQMNPA